jgi:Leucine-rich repeat (LRR) protein
VQLLIKHLYMGKSCHNLEPKMISKIVLSQQSKGLNYNKQNIQETLREWNTACISKQKTIPLYLLFSLFCTLNLTNMKINSVDNPIQEFTNLVHLRLTGNHITSINYLPPNILFLDLGANKYSLHDTYNGNKTTKVYID